VATLPEQADDFAEEIGHPGWGPGFPTSLVHQSPYQLPDGVVRQLGVDEQIPRGRKTDVGATMVSHAVKDMPLTCLGVDAGAR
jgi:hypothetical protein